MVRGTSRRLTRSGRTSRLPRFAPPAHAGAGQTFDTRSRSLADLLAFGLCLALFFYFLLVGSPVVRALHASRSAVQDLLIAPVVGLGATLIPLFLLNRAGLPILSFGRG